MGVASSPLLPTISLRDNPEPEDNLRTEPVDPKTAGKLLIVVGVWVIYQYFIDINDNLQY